LNNIGTMYDAWGQYVKALYRLVAILCTLRQRC